MSARVLAALALVQTALAAWLWKDWISHFAIPSRLLSDAIAVTALAALFWALAIWKAERA